MSDLTADAWGRGYTRVIKKEMEKVHKISPWTLENPQPFIKALYIAHDLSILGGYLEAHGIDFDCSFYGPFRDITKEQKQELLK